MLDDAVDDAEQAEQARERLHAAPQLHDLAPCDLVIEAAPEDLDVKRELFERLLAGANLSEAQRTQVYEGNVRKVFSRFK